MTLNTNYSTVSKAYHNFFSSDCTSSCHQTRSGASFRYKGKGGKEALEHSKNVVKFA